MSYYSHHGITAAKQGERAVLQLPGRIALGMNVGNLLQLERPFQGYGVVNTPADVEYIVVIGQLPWWFALVVFFSDVIYLPPFYMIMRRLYAAARQRQVQNPK